MDRSADGSRGVRRYRLYGLTLASGFPFTCRLAGAAAGPPDLRFECSSRAPLAVAWADHRPAWVNPHRTSEGRSLSALYRLADCEVLRFHRVADFYLWNDRIFCHLLDAAYAGLLEIPLLGLVLSYWLERRGVATLHASVVAVGGGALAFLSFQGGGKTTLAAAMMRAGHRLLTDDVLAIERRDGSIRARPGYPQMRMWPDQASFFLGGYRDLDVVHPAHSKRKVPVGGAGFGSFCRSSRRLSGLYLLERRETPGVESTRASQREAVIELVRNSFAPELVEAAGLQPARLDLFSRLVAEVPVRRLRYGAGFDLLPAVCDRILEDLAKPAKERLNPGGPDDTGESRCPT